MRMALSGRPICCASTRRLGNATLAAPYTVELPARRIPFGQQPARLHRHRAVALHLEALAADVGRARESGVGVAAHAGEREREIAACRLEQQDVVASRGGAVHDRRQRLDVERDRVERILGDGGAVRQHDRDRLADIAHLVVRR